MFQFLVGSPNPPNKEDLMSDHTRSVLAYLAAEDARLDERVAHDIPMEGFESPIRVPLKAKYQLGGSNYKGTRSA